MSTITFGHMLSTQQPACAVFGRRGAGVSSLYNVGAPATLTVLIEI